MKQKTHSGLKKRIKVRQSGAVSVGKAAKNHLLSNKSKGQKKSHLSGMPVNETRMKAIRKLMPGTVGLKKVKKVVVKIEEKTEKKVEAKVA